MHSRGPGGLSSHPMHPGSAHTRQRQDGRRAGGGIDLWVCGSIRVYACSIYVHMLYMCIYIAYVCIRVSR